MQMNDANKRTYENLKARCRPAPLGSGKKVKGLLRQRLKPPQGLGVGPRSSSYNLVLVKQMFEDIFIQSSFGLILGHPKEGLYNSAKQKIL